MNLHINELPDSTLLTIFSYFSLREVCSMQLVCKKWLELLQDFSLWSDIVVDHDSHLASILSEDMLGAWLRRWDRHVKILRLRYCRKLTNFTGQLIANSCTRIVSIDLQGCIGIGDYGLALIAESCSMLKRVNLFMTGITDIGCSNLVRKIPTILSIKLPSKGNCYRSLDSICSNCHKVDALVLNDVIPFDQTDPVINDGIITTVATCFPAIRKISLSWCWYITDECLLMVAEYCKGLSHLVIKECHQITDYGVSSIIKNCQNLRKLQLGRLYGVTDNLAKAFDGKPNRLQRLKLVDTSITDNGISRILGKAPDMVGVFVGEYCFNGSKITGEFLFNCIKYCKKIVELVIISCKTVNDDMLFCITENLPNLKTLCLSSCLDVTKAGLESILYRLGQLRVLRICKCDDFDDSMLDAFSEMSVSLLAIELYGCSKISYEGVKNFLKKKPNCSIRL